MSADVAEAYNATSSSWCDGPAVVYNRLAEVLCARCPIELRGARMLDVGSGTGAATLAARRRGADVVALDIAVDMLRAAPERALSVAGSAVALPFASHAFDAVVAAFSLNHLTDPVAGLREAARVLRPGGGLAVSAYAEDDWHPVRDATEAAAAARGWVRPDWYRRVRAEAVPQLATVDRAAAAAAAAGLDAEVTAERVVFADMSAEELVAWRLGMAHLAPFASTLDSTQRSALQADALERLGPNTPTLVRSMIVLTSTVA